MVPDFEKNINLDLCWMSFPDIDKVELTVRSVNLQNKMSDSDNLSWFIEDIWNETKKSKAKSFFVIKEKFRKKQKNEPEWTW